MSLKGRARQSLVYATPRVPAPPGHGLPAAPAANTKARTECGLYEPAFRSKEIGLIEADYSPHCLPAPGLKAIIVRHEPPGAGSRQSREPERRLSDANYRSLSAAIHPFRQTS